MAVATPTMLPVPTRPERAMAKAWNEVMPVFWVLSVENSRRAISPKRRTWTKRVPKEKYRPASRQRPTSAGLHTHPLTVLMRLSIMGQVLIERAKIRKPRQFLGGIFGNIMNDSVYLLREDPREELPLSERLELLEPELPRLLELELVPLERLLELLLEALLLPRPLLELVELPERLLLELLELEALLLPRPLELLLVPLERLSLRLLELEALLLPRPLLELELVPLLRPLELLPETLPLLRPLLELVPLERPLLELLEEVTVPDSLRPLLPLRPLMLPEEVVPLMLPEELPLLSVRTEVPDPLAPLMLPELLPEGRTEACGATGSLTWLYPGVS